MTSKAFDPLEIHANSFLATVFDDPGSVLADPLLDDIQKRCILATWASDAFAVEERPWLRRLPGSAVELSLSSILAALRRLDGEDDPPPHAPVGRIRTSA